jgi:hypothetical protein
VQIRALESLEVRLKPLNLFAGFAGGAALAAIVGSVVAGVGNAQRAPHEYYVPIWYLAAPAAGLGALIGIAYAHDRGERWKRVALPTIDKAAMYAPNQPLHPTGTAPPPG